MISFGNPAALALLAVVLLQALPRRARGAPRHYVVFNLPRAVARGLPAPPRLRRLPSYLLLVFLAVLVLAIAEPRLGTTEEYLVQESKTIVQQIDTSGSMLGTPIKNVQAVAEEFIRERPKEDRLGLIAFDDVAMGGIPTTNHDGLIKELRAIKIIPGRGTQVGIGLFKALESFIEEDVEARLAEDRTLDVPAREAKFREMRRELEVFASHLLRREAGDFMPQLHGVADPRAVGRGKVLIVLTDADFLAPDSPEERINYVRVLEYFERFGLTRLYMLSPALGLPKELTEVFRRNEGWRFYQFSTRDHDRLREMFHEISRIEKAPTLVAFKTEHRDITLWFAPSLGLVLLATALGVLVPRFRTIP